MNGKPQNDVTNFFLRTSVKIDYIEYKFLVK